MIRLSHSTAMFVLAVAAAAPLACGGAAGAQTLVIENVIGRVVIETGDYDTITVDISGPDDRLAHPTVSGDGVDVRIDGGVHNPGLRCRGGDQSPTIGLRNASAAPLSAYPQIVVRAPVGTSLELGGAGLFADIGDVGAARITLSHCGHVHLGDVAGELHILSMGVGEVTAGVVGGGAVTTEGRADVTVAGMNGATQLELNGAGEIEVGFVNGDLSVELNGVGHVTVGELQGALNAASNGTGDIVIEAGHAPHMQAEANGMGAKVTFAGTADTARLEANGFAGVRVDRVVGNLSREANMARIRVRHRGPAR